MFGFGRPAKEKAVVYLVKPVFESLGLSSTEAEKSATAMFDEVKEQTLKKTPDIYRTDVGTINVANLAFLEPRIKAGLAHHDIEAFWNRPLIVVMCELKMKEMIGLGAGLPLITKTMTYGYVYRVPRRNWSGVEEGGPSS